jgi:hypothetical protein
MTQEHYVRDDEQDSQDAEASEESLPTTTGTPSNGQAEKRREDHPTQHNQEHPDDRSGHGQGNQHTLNVTWVVHSISQF